MKSAKYLLIGLALVLPMSVFAADYTFKERVIKVVQMKEYLEVTIVNDKIKEPIIYRIYPCGEVQMQEWKKLAPNKEPDTAYGVVRPYVDHNYVFDAFTLEGRGSTLQLTPNIAW